MMKLNNEETLMQFNNPHTLIKRYVDFQLSYYDFFGEFSGDKEEFFKKFFSLESATNELINYRSEVEANIQQIEDALNNRVNDQCVIEEFNRELKILKLALEVISHE